MSNEQIVSRYKASAHKIDEIMAISEETGKSIVDIFKLLIEHKVDCRAFCQSQLKQQYFEARDSLKSESIETAKSATISMNQLKEENNNLKKQLAKLKCKSFNDGIDNMVIERKYKERMEELEAENARLRKLAETVVSEKSDELVGQLEATTQNYNESVELITRLEKENALFSAENDILKGKLHKAEQYILEKTVYCEVQNESV